MIKALLGGMEQKGDGNSEGYDEEESSALFLFNLRVVSL